MKKLIVIGVTTLAALFVALGVAPSAYAYPELTCNLTVDHQVIFEGESFTATGTAVEMEKAARAAAVGDNIQWVMTWNGETRTGNGATFVQTFKAPHVSKKTSLPLVATASSSVGTCPHTINITVLPNGTSVTPPGNGGGLPNTGGPRLILLLAGLGLVVAGGVAIRQSRKGHEAAGY